MENIDVYLERLIRNALKLSDEKDVLDYLSIEETFDVVEEDFKMVDDDSHQMALLEEFSPPDFIVKRAFLRPVIADHSERYIHVTFPYISSQKYLIFDPDLIESDPFVFKGARTLYEKIQVVEEGSFWVGNLDDRKKLSLEKSTLTPSSHKHALVYEHVFFMPWHRNALHLKHLGCGTWLCESSYGHHQGELNTLPIIPYGGMVERGQPLEHMHSYFALPLIQNEQSLKCVIKNAEELFREGAFHHGISRGGMRYVMPSSIKLSGAPQSLALKIESGQLKSSLKWPPYESPFLYQSCSYSRVSEALHQIDICYQRLN